MPPKRTSDNQGYWDRRHRAEASSDRAKSLKEQAWEEGPFIVYWIAFNALSGPHNERRETDSKDMEKCLERMCHMDQEDGSLS